MKSSSSISVPSVGIFEREVDTIVFGAGFTGFAAANTLAASDSQGASTLLVEPSGNLLWEATRALENTTASSTSLPGCWSRWLDTLRIRGGANDDFFDPALAEILTAHNLTAPTADLSALLYAVPVAAETTGNRLDAVIVATKAGPRRLRARRWIDATEQGMVARLVQPSLVPRQPNIVYRSAVLHSLQPQKLDDALNRLVQNHPGLTWLPSVRFGERRLRWPADRAENLWHRKVPALITDLRALLAAENAASAHFIVSHCAMHDFPVYNNASPNHSFADLPANLAVASPALHDDALATPADRFALGTRVAAGLPAPPPSAQPSDQSPAVLPEPAVTLEAYDVMVAGVGTGGAVAAITAARHGARTLAIDSETYPGGIGTGAGISGYFHGAKGGFQSEIDERVQAMTTLLNDRPASQGSWHHEAKKIVLLSLFDDAGVTFLGDVLLAGVERDASGRVQAALAVIEGRLTRLPAAAFIDGTGDGDLAVWAGADFAFGRPGDSRALSYSQSVFSLVPADDRLRLRPCNFDAGWVDPTDPEDLTRARLTGIAQHMQPDWTQADRPVAVAPLLGLRQSRQIETDVRITMDDLISRARFDDAIGEVATVADTHSVDFEFETDTLAFYYWTCRGFRHPLRSELPYRMLLPKGVANVWLACRAAGIDVDAAYGLRMQREMQRFGEAAGLAAALAVAGRTDARGIDMAAFMAALDRSGSRPAERLDDPAPTADTLLEALGQGIPGVHLWHLFRQGDRHYQAVKARLNESNPRVSFYAAALLAMWKDNVGEPRLIKAMQNREEGPTPAEYPAPGAFTQCIDLPFWLQAAVLLRRIGTERCLPTLRAIAETPSQPLNVRTILALTLERLAARYGQCDDLIAALEALLTDAIPDAVLPPSRSLWRTLRGEPQKKLGNDRGAPVAQDHTWQLHLVVARTRMRLNLPMQPEASAFHHDPRAFVRQAFAQMTNDLHGIELTEMEAGHRL